MAARLIRPPIRTALMNNPDGTPMNQIPAANGSSSGPANSSSSTGAGQITTQKNWYRYWGDCGDQINANTDKLDNLVTFGTHANRPDPANMPNGALYFESDRNVIYANVDGVWHYAAGTMWGTLTPDQRPTDLGAPDAGFDFRTTDQPAREFIWSQGAWIEATPVRYGTHAQRLAVVIADVIEQMLWVETDRTVLYQLMQLSGPTPVWQYIAGTMWGTISPDQRPTDLGTHDAGFDYRTTDSPPREFIWSGGAWVETTPAAANSVSIAYASAALTLTTSPQNIPGCSLTLSRAGTYLITGCFDFMSIDGPNVNLLGSLNGGAAQYAVFEGQNTTANMRSTVYQQWVMSVTAGFVAQLTAYKTGGAAVSYAQTQSSIAAIWVSP